MAWGLTGANPLPQAMQTYCQLYFKTYISITYIWKSKAFTFGNALENVVCEMAGVLSRPHCVYKWHDDVIKWRHFPRYWPFVRGIHRSPVNSPYKGQWRGALMFSLTCVWINGWVNNREAGDLRRYRAHYDVTVMLSRPHCVYKCISLSVNIHVM